jgi:hypothetical protein
MKRRTAIILIVSSGLLGVAIGIVASRFGTTRAESYVLRQDLDLGSTYFFGADPPVKGRVAAGSKVEIEFRHSRADYVAFHTVIDRDVLKKIATPVVEK